MAEITSNPPICQLQRLTSHRPHPIYKQMKTLILIFFALDKIVVNSNSNRQELSSASVMIDTGSLTNRLTRLDPVM